MTLIEDIAAEFAAIPEVEAVALGGSRATGQNDRASDIDLYVYSREGVPVKARLELATRRGDPIEMDNRYWETGDEWDEQASGIHVDIMYRQLGDIRSDLQRVLEQHEASIGYTTCVAHNVATSVVMFDRRGEFENLQTVVRQPYPLALAKAIIGKNLPLLRDSFGAFGRQVVKAAEREDQVAVNHRTASFLGSYFDILFAANRALHPGEKRLLELAVELPIAPPNMSIGVNKLLTSQGPVELFECVDDLTDGIVRVLERERTLR